MWAPKLGSNGERCTRVSTASFQQQRCLCVYNLRSEDSASGVQQVGWGQGGVGFAQSPVEG